MALFEPGPPPEETNTGKAKRARQRRVSAAFLGAITALTVPFVAFYLGAIVGIFIRALEIFA